jgi:hypothetical protein
MALRSSGSSRVRHDQSESASDWPALLMVGEISEKVRTLYVR